MWSNIIILVSYKVLYITIWILHAQSTKNQHVTLFDHCISKTARYSILTPLVKKFYLGDKLLNPEYQVIASRPFIYQQIQCDNWAAFFYRFPKTHWGWAGDAEVWNG